MQTIVKNISDYRPTPNSIAPASIQLPATSATLIPNNHLNSNFFRFLEKSGIYLNQQQIDVLTCQSGHVLVNALAGTGKTSCIVALISYLMQTKSINHENILALAYTKKSAQELQERLDRLSSNAHIFTFSALCYKIIRENGFSRYRLLTDDNVRVSIMNSILKEHPFDSPLQADNLLSLNSYYLNTMTEPDDPDIIKAIDYYQSYKTEHMLLDFDDILTEALHLLQHNTKLLNLLQLRFKYVIVDEFQDFNPLQYALLKLLCGKGRFFGFGDRHQAIYSFRGADPHIMEMSTQHFKGTEISMHTSYRCTSQVLGVANKLLSTGCDHDSKLLAVKSGKPVILIRPYDTMHQAKYVAQKISTDVSTGKRSYGDFAVLFRSLKSSVVIIEEFLLGNIPFKTNQPVQTLYDAPICLFLVSHLKLVIDRSNITTLTKILPSLYLSKPRVQKFLNNLPETKNADLLLLLEQIPSLHDYQRELLQRRCNLLNRLKRKSPIEAIDILVHHSDIKKHLHLPNMSDADSMEVVTDTIGQLKEDSKQFTTIQDFIYHINLIQEKSSERQRGTDSEENAVQLMTIHSSKGLQHDFVFLIDAIEGQIPHQKVLDSASSFSATSLQACQMSGSIEEEKRLLYVAVTRAKEELTISAPINHNGSPSKLSRFLEPFSGHFVTCK